MAAGPEHDDASERFVLEEVPRLLRAAGREPGPVEHVTETSTLVGGRFRRARDVRRTRRTPEGTAWTLGEVPWPVIVYDHHGDEAYRTTVPISVALRTAPVASRVAPHPMVVMLRPGTSTVAASTAFTHDDSSWAPVAAEDPTRRDGPTLWPVLADLARRLLADG